MEAQRQPGAWAVREIVLVLSIGLAFSTGVLLEWEPLNGIRAWTKWEWGWRNDLSVIKTALCLLLPFIALASVVWRIGARRSCIPLASLAVLVLANFSLQITGTLADPRGLPLVADIVASDGATSYFSDALLIRDLGEWIRQFPRYIQYLHSATHPPGPVLFYYAFLILFGSHAALLGGLAVGLLGAAGVPIVYRFAGLWTDDRDVRLLASAFYALNPALIVFFPEFDQVYPIFAMLIILLWSRALSGSVLYAAAFGAVLFVSTFFAYGTLVIGAFLVYYAIYWLWRIGETTRWLILVRAAVVSLGTGVGLFLLLWLATGYDPVFAFRRALINQKLLAGILARPYLPFAVVDPYDFILGAGVIALPFLFFHLRRSWNALTLIGIATILTVDISGLLRAEAARVWLFLQPLVTVPVAMELSALRRPWLLAVFALQWWIIVCLKAKMIFIEP